MASMHFKHFTEHLTGRRARETGGFKICTYNGHVGWVFMSDGLCAGVDVYAEAAMYESWRFNTAVHFSV